MFGSGSRRLLLLAACSFAVLGPTALAAATSSSGSSSSSCAPPAFTGSVRSHASACVPTPTPGALGPRGPRGVAGPAGHRGSRGRRGVPGPQGVTGVTGLTGSTGAIGPAGLTGATGATGPSVTGNFAEFFALMPPDNAATVAPNTAVQFPQNGPMSGTIARLGAGTFNLPNVGTYRMSFSVSVTEPGQLVVSLNTAQLPYTVYGRATGTSQIAGTALVQTSTVNSVLSINNPVGKSPPLTITPVAGGVDPAVASLVIEQIK